MSELKLTVPEIEELMEKMAETGLTTLRIKDGEFTLCLKSGEKEVREVILPGTAVPGTAVPGTAVTAPSAVPVPAAPAPAKPEEPSGNVVKSPIIGTFYAAPGPDKAPFVSVGKAVKKGDTLFIIESMKLMNEIQSEYDGVVKKILVQDGQGVEYGQPILIIE